MQSLQERHAVHISCMNLEKEDDSGPAQLHLPRIRSLVNSAQEENGNVQQELFSLKIRHCGVFKTVPLPHIGNKMAPCLGDPGGRAGPTKQFLGFLFSPEKDALEKMFSHFDSAATAGWQRKAHRCMSDLGMWSCSGDNFVQFAHFWLSELQHNQKQQLLELEMGIIEDKLRLVLLQGSDTRELQPLDFNAILAAVLSEYPTGLISSQSSSVFLDYLNFMSSDQMPGYKKMLSSVQYPSKNPQIAQWLLAVRAFVLANLWHAIVKTRPIPDVNQVAENGSTPLHAAVNTGKMHLVSLLLHYPGINVNAPNPQCDGATPLHLAIVYGQLGICYLLLNAAADVESPVGGLTPLQLADEFGNEAIIGLLKMHVKRFKLESKMLGLSALEF